MLADPQAARGSFPLVVFSHGNGGVRFQSWFLMEALASHGFVVAAPDHAGNTALDAIAGTSDPFGDVRLTDQQLASIDVPTLPIDEAQRVTDLYVVSFLTEELKGSSRYSRYLSRGYADRHDLPVELLVKPEGRHRGRGAT